MTMPTKPEMMELVRSHYGLTLQQVCDLLNMPLHPYTLRDDIAKAALTGLLANPGHLETPPRLIAVLAYAQADDVLTERKLGCC